MIIDVHVHVSACTPGHGSMSPRLLGSLPFRFMQWRLGIRGATAETERALAAKLVQTVNETPIDAAAILAFDAVHDRDGRLDAERTHLHVTNDYARDLAQQHAKLLFAASIHPYRKDAVAELERCAAGGAVLLKWLPIVQDFDPSDPLCLPLYEALAHHRIPLLCHTGGEQALPNLNRAVADPELLRPALERGVTVIMAHCGTKSSPRDVDYLPSFMRLAREFEHCYGDTSALNLPSRWYAWRHILADPLVRQKLIHGSDWPIIALPNPAQVGWGPAWRMMRDRNWMRRDVKIKQRLDLDEAYWHRAARILRLPEKADQTGSTSSTRR